MPNGQTLGTSHLTDHEDVIPSPSLRLGVVGIQSLFRVAGWGGQDRSSVGVVTLGLRVA